jgi:signal transduction histidine kinase
VLLPDREHAPRWLRVTHTVGLDLELDEERAVESFGVIRDALADAQGQRYWSLKEHGTEDYVPLAQGIECEFVSVLRVGGRMLAVIDVESTRPALSERYQRAIRRCSFYAASLVEGLRRRAEAERNRALKDGLDGVQYETHIARNILRLLVGNLKSEADLSPTSRGYIEEIRQRLEDGEALVSSFGEPPKPLALGEILAEVQQRAAKIHLPLELEGDLDLRVIGNHSGFIWLFENLISNSRRHARGGQGVRAWLHVERDQGRGRMRYWDNGQDPTAIDRFLDGRSLRQGWSHIQGLCKLYGWEVEPKSEGEGHLLFEFTFNHLGNDRAEVVK